MFVDQGVSLKTAQFMCYKILGDLEKVCILFLCALLFQMRVAVTERAQKRLSLLYPAKHFG